MSKIDSQKIKKLRDETGAPVIRVKKVLEEVGGDRDKAFEILQKEGFEKAEKKEGRETSQGEIFSYVHHTKKIATLVEVFCETDFVARNELFSELGRNLALQAASMNPKDAEELLAQDFIKDPGKKVIELVKEVIAKTGENVKVGRVIRFELGK